MVTIPGNRPQPFPLIRHFSARATPVLLRLPVTPNQITLASLVIGLGAAWCIAQGAFAYAILGGLALSISYVLDNCDGEVARAKNLRSEIGRHLDDISDWLVHAAIFLAIGQATYHETGDEIWWWLGAVAAFGATASYLAVRIQDLLGPPRAGLSPVEGEAMTPPPSAPKDFAIYVFRELFRADFCFIVLVLAVADLLWLLLPLGAVGSQVYWLSAFARGARDYHV